MYRELKAALGIGGLAVWSSAAALIINPRTSSTAALATAECGSGACTCKAKDTGCACTAIGGSCFANCSGGSESRCDSKPKT